MTKIQKEISLDELTDSSEIGTKHWSIGAEITKIFGVEIPEDLKFFENALQNQLLLKNLYKDNFEFGEEIESSFQRIRNFLEMVIDNAEKRCKRRLVDLKREVERAVKQKDFSNKHFELDSFKQV